MLARFGSLPWALLELGDCLAGHARAPGIESRWRFHLRLWREPREGIVADHEGEVCPLLEPLVTRSPQAAEAAWCRSR
jgi:hypothetical protein